MTDIACACIMDTKWLSKSNIMEVSIYKMYLLFTYIEQLYVINHKVLHCICVMVEFSEDTDHCIMS